MQPLSRAAPGTLNLRPASPPSQGDPNEPDAAKMDASRPEQGADRVHANHSEAVSNMGSYGPNQTGLSETRHWCPAQYFNRIQERLCQTCVQKLRLWCKCFHEVVVCQSGQRT